MSIVHGPSLRDGVPRARASDGYARGRPELHQNLGLADIYLGVRYKSLVIFGPSQTGKSTWARSLGNHFFARGKFNGREFVKVEQSVDYYVLDDMEGGLRFFPGWKHFLGMQTWFNVRQFHRDPPMVKGGKPCIWLCNLDPRDEMYANLRHNESRVQVDNDVAWLEANCIFVEVHEPIFRANIA